MTMNQDNHAPGQDDGFSSGGEEFVFTEEKRPVNRNMMVLLLIAVVGGGLVYLMYLRTRGGIDLDSEATKVKSQQVAEFMKKGEQDLKELDAVLQKMQTQVGVMESSPTASQVKTEDLRTNPFQVEKDAPPAEIARVPDNTPVDETRMAVMVLAKAEVQMITFSARGSTCIVNNKLCSEGDHITISGMQFTVKQIATDFIVLQNGAGEFKVTMKGKGL